MNIYYTIYETTCIVNNKKYRGAHQTTNPNDEYIGSGSLFKRAVRKYGKHNFVKTVLFYALSESDMYAAERWFVDEEWVNNSDTYNIKPGGLGGAGNRPQHVKNSISKALAGRKKPEGFGAKISKAMTGKPSTRLGRNITPSHRANISIAKKGVPAKQVTCPYCKKTGGAGAMSRYHFEKCRYYCNS